jgi:hypothetical protein
MSFARELLALTYLIVDIWLSEHRAGPYLNELFVFANTPEGHRYWASLAYRHHRNPNR